MGKSDLLALDIEGNGERSLHGARDLEGATDFACGKIDFGLTHYEAELRAHLILNHAVQHIGPFEEAGEIGSGVGDQIFCGF